MRTSSSAVALFCGLGLLASIAIQDAGAARRNISSGKASGGQDAGSGAQRAQDKSLPVQVVPLMGLPRSPDRRPDSWKILTTPDGMDPDGQAIPWFPHREGENALQAWLRKRQEVERVFEPFVTLNVLDFQVRALTTACIGGDKRACGQRDAMATAQSSLQAGVSLATDCDRAASAFGGSSSPNAAGEYDLRCLGSFVDRLDRGSALSTPPPYDILRPGPGSALDAIGILEAEGVPFCAGLLRPGGKLVTARHCYTGRFHDAFVAGDVTVRPASGNGAPWKVGSINAKPAATDSDAVEHDWIVFDVPGAAGFALPAVKLETMPLAGEVTLVGHFSYYDKVQYPAGTSTVPWRRGLRFPRQGLCQAVKLVGKCLQMACQTIPGFSGTPVFRSQPDDESSLRVVGFVSRNEGMGTNCGSPFPNATLAVSAASIQ